MKKESITKSFLFFILIIISASIVFAELPIGLQKVREYEINIALSITFLIAFIGGIISFTSPCGFVLIPTFISFMFKERKRAMLMTLAFALGLLVTFTIFGLIAGYFGNFFNPYKSIAAKIAGVFTIIFGLLILLNINLNFLDFRIKHKPNKGFASIFLLGILFALGWSPCVGSILFGIITLSTIQGGAIYGALMLMTFSLGVALPMLVIAYISDKYDWSNIKWLTGKHLSFNLLGKKISTHVYNLISGLILLIIGVIIYTYNGTGFFQQSIPRFVDWDMNFFNRVNNYLVDSKIFNSFTSNIIGLILIIVIIFWIWRSIKPLQKS